MTGTTENLKASLNSVNDNIAVLTKQIIARSSPEAKKMNDGFNADLRKIQSEYSRIDTGDHQRAITELIKLQAKEEYVRDIVCGFENPINQKNTLEEQRKKLQKELKDREDTVQTR